MNLAGFILFSGASVGHIAILVYSLNWWYGLPFPHRLLSSVKLLHGILVALGVAAFAYAWTFPLSIQDWLAPQTLGSVVASAYTIVCAFVGFAVVPIITLRRNLRGKPAV